MKNLKRMLSTIMIIMIILSTMTIQAFADSASAIPTDLQATATSNFNTLALNAAPTKPAIPTNLQATTTGSSITLTWNAVYGASKYNIEQIGGESFTVDAPNTSYTFEGLMPETTYSFKVMAVNDQGSSDWSALITIATSLTPATPTILKAKPTGDSVTLYWDAIAGATKYNIEQIGGKSITVTAPATARSVISLQPRTTYSFRVMAVSDKASSNWSNPVTVTTLSKVYVTSTKINVGDINSDGSVDSLDFASMNMFLLGTTPTINTKVADLDGDGNVNSIDYAIMKSFLLKKIREFPHKYLYTDPKNPINVKLYESFNISLTEGGFAGTAYSCSSYGQSNLTFATKEVYNYIPQCCDVLYQSVWTFTPTKPGKYTLLFSDPYSYQPDFIEYEINVQE